jgi:hypothetical protein
MSGRIFKSAKVALKLENEKFKMQNVIRAAV